MALDHGSWSMALDHSRLGLENKLLQKIRPNFLLSTSLLYKILPTNLGVCKPTFSTFYTSQLRWNSTIYLQTSDRMQYFTIFQDKLHSVNIQDDQLWAFSETVQKISKITYTASRFSLLTSAKFAVNINRVTLHHNKEFTIFIFLFNCFITMCIISQRVWYAKHFEYSCMRCSWTTETNSTEIKIARETTSNQ